MPLFIFLGLEQWTVLSNQEQNLVYHVFQLCPVHLASGGYYCPVLQDLYLPEGKQKDGYSIFIITLTKKQDHSLPRASSRARQRKTNNTLFCISLTFCLR